MNLKNKKILIVGGCGFIGHNLGVHLKSKGADVYLLDSLTINNMNSVLDNKDSLPNPEISMSFLNERMRIIKLKDIKLIIQDARDYHAMSKIIDNVKPEILIHLAAVSHANRSNKDPYSTFDHSLRTLENSLDCAKSRIKHFIYFSSSMVYGNFLGASVEEDFQCNPMGIYGALKYSGEKIVIAYNQVFDLPYTIVRPSALYGERCISRRVGQIFIENAISEKDIIIDGDGSDVLDFTYIKDLVYGIEKIIENKNSINQIFNLTYGAGRKISELIDILKKEFPKIVVKRKDRDRLMPERGTLSINKAKSLIGYNPTWPIETGYLSYIQWYKEFMSRKHDV